MDETLFYTEPNEATRQFMAEHAHCDVLKTALRKPALPEVDVPWALVQIAGRQKAQTKLPQWAAEEAVCYPPKLSMEQCSSQQTALHKVEVVKQMRTHEAPDPRETLADVTGGFGVDCFYLSAIFQQVFYVEQQPVLCQVAKHNFGVLKAHNIEVVNAESQQWLRNCKPVDWLFVDPARRGEKGEKVMLMDDCSPNVPELLPLLFEKCNRLLLKLSPMLDIDRAVKTLHEKGGKVLRIDVVAVKNECKELLMVVEKSTDAAEELTEGARVQWVCVNGEQVFSTSNVEEKALQTPLCHTPIEPGMFLFEPHAALMKMGCWASIAQKTNTQMVAKNSHLFVARADCKAFPGRRFVVNAVSSFNKKALKACLQNVKQAHVATRNFPLQAAELRKRLRLKDGGSHYIFATTDTNARHLLLVCTKCE